METNYLFGGQGFIGRKNCQVLLNVESICTYRAGEDRALLRKKGFDFTDLKWKKTVQGRGITVRGIRHK